MSVHIENFEFWVRDFKKYQGSSGGLRAEVGWIILPSHHFKGKEMRTAYGKWFQVKLPSGLSFYRQICFSPVLKKSEVLVDRFAITLIDSEHGVDERKLVLEIRRVRWWSIFQAWLQHPDSGIRASTILGLLGAILGLLSFLLAVLGLIQSAH